MTQTMKEIRRVVRLLAKLTDEEWERLGKVISDNQEEIATEILPYTSKERTYEDVTKLIHMLGVPANIKGYDYLREAVIYCIKADNMRNVAVTRELYPMIAKEFETTPQRVERAIRHAIQRVYEKGNKETVIMVFGNIQFAPTNSEAIATMAEYLKNNKI